MEFASWLENKIKSIENRSMSIKQDLINIYIIVIITALPRFNIT